MKNLGRVRTSLLLVALMISSTALAGCTSTFDDDDSQNPNAAPKQAMGMWWPTIDGIIDNTNSAFPYLEWSDGVNENIEFVDESNGKHPAELRYKSVGYGMALAVEIDGVEVTPQSVIVEFPNSNIVLTSQITTLSAEGEDTDPYYEEVFPSNLDQTDLFDNVLLDFLTSNEIATIHDLGSDKLTMEASAKYLFDDTTETIYTITIVFSDDKWTYSRIIDFDWILPFLFPRSDIGVTGIEVTQAIQTADMQMRLVKGKTSMARVYVESGDLDTANVEVGLRACVMIFCTPQTVISHVAVQNPDRTVITDSANFILPESWVSSDIIALIATVNPIYPTGAIDYVDPDTSNNVFWDIFWFNHTRELVVWGLPVPQDVVGDNALEVRPFAIRSAWYNDAEVMFPVPNIRHVDFLSSSVIDGTGLSSSAITSNIDAQAAVTIAQMNAQLADGVDPGFPLPDQVHGITPAGGTGGGISTPAWSASGSSLSLSSMCGNSVQNFPVTGLNDPPASTCPAHEMTHNMGPRCNDLSNPLDGDCTDSQSETWGAHLNICGAGGNGVVSGSPGANIQDLGWDPIVANPDTTQIALYTATYPGYMGYCRASTGPSTGFLGGNWNVPYVSRLPQWIPTYLWEELYDKFLNWQDGSPAAPFNGKQSQNFSMRSISGVIPRDGSTGSLDYSWSGFGMVSSQYRNYGDSMTQSDYSIVTRTQNGQEIDKIRFDSVFVDPHDDPTDHYFSYLVQDNNQAIHSIELLDSNGSMIDSLYSSGTPTTSISPLGATSYTRDQSVSVDWSAASPTSSRETMYSVEYTWKVRGEKSLWLPIGGMTNSTSAVFELGALPGSDAAKFRVRATNGFDTYYSESTSFSVPNQAPELTLETSGALGIQTVGFDVGPVNSGNHVSITQGATFSIKPIITDADWTPVNEDGFSTVLKRDGETVWAHGGDSNWRAPNRVVSMMHSIGADCPTGPGSYCTIEAFTFPNADLLPGEMKPGAYEFVMTYEDEAGSSVTETVSFSIIVPNYLVGADSSATTSEVLDEYRSALETTELDVDLSRNEMHYYVELERAARADEGALSDVEIDDLQALYGISDSRAAELAVMICVPPDCQLL